VTAANEADTTVTSSDTSEPIEYRPWHPRGTETRSEVLDALPSTVSPDRYVAILPAYRSALLCPVASLSLRRTEPSLLNDVFRCPSGQRMMASSPPILRIPCAGA
jgi:hypothetical protein